jgi:hypothetical protein
MKQKAADHIIFHHVPKTAGTTLYAIIDNSFSGRIHTISGNQTEHESSKKEFEQMSADQQNEIDLLKGHRTFGMDSLFSGTVKYFTVLRKPAQRHISGYYQLLKVKPELEERKNFIEAPPSLEEYIRNGDIYFGKNPQLKTFLNIADPKVEVDEALFQDAIRIMKEQYFMVGLTERFDETCVLLNQFEGFHISKYVRKNVAKNYNPNLVSKELIELYNRLHPFDVRFYEAAVDLFQNKWQKLQDRDDLLRNFQSNNLKWNRRFQRKEKWKTLIRKLIRKN